MKKSNKKSEKKKKIFYKKIQSTQKVLPIKELSNGIIITKNNKYVKILEVIPTPYFMKNENEQAKIYRCFYEMFKIAPVSIQLKCLSIKADASKQIKKLEENRLKETNDDCIKFYNDYRQRLLEAQETGTKTRFFIIFTYEKNNMSLYKKTSKNKMNVIVEQLNLVSSRIASKMVECGNKVIQFNDYSSQNNKNAEILYTIFNRDKITIEPFDSHMNNVLQRYYDYYGDNDFYLPVTDYIAPDSIDYTNKKYLKVNDTYYKFLCVPKGGYNPYVYPGFMNLLVSQGTGVDVDVFYKKETGDVQSGLKKTLGHSLADINDSRINSDASEAAQSTYATAYYLRQGLMAGQDLYYVSVLITVTGTSIEEVEYKANAIINTCKQQDIRLLELKYQNKQAFESTLPLCSLDRDIFKKSFCNVLTETAAAFYPFTTYEMNHDDGIYIGDDMYTGSPVIIDYFNKDEFTNPNVFIAGTSGAGKTFGLLLQAIRTRLSRMPIYILSPEKENEFRRLCDALGGQFVQIAKGSPTRINPMEIFMKDQQAVENQKLIDGAVDTISYVTDKVNMLVKFCQMFTGQLEFEEKTILEDCFIRTYERFGMTVDNNSLWNESHTKFKKMPIFDDFKYELNHMEHVPKKLQQLANLLTSGNAQCFNGQTNINTNSDFIVFGLEHNDEEMLPVAIFLAMDFVWSKIKEDRTKKKMMFIDEWWKMAYNKIAADYSMEIARTIRAYNGGIVFATQQMTDILAAGDAGSSILGNCAVQILMKMKPRDLEAVSKMLELSDSDKSTIERFKAGDALLVAGNNREMIHFQASENERLLCSTDENTLREYMQIKQTEIEKEKVKQEREQAPDLDDLFTDSVGNNDDDQIELLDYDDDIFVSVTENLKEGDIRNV